MEAVRREEIKSTPVVEKSEPAIAVAPAPVLPASLTPAEASAPMLAGQTPPANPPRAEAPQPQAEAPQPQAEAPQPQVPAARAQQAHAAADARQGNSNSKGVSLAQAGLTARHGYSACPHARVAA